MFSITGTIPRPVCDISDDYICMLSAPVTFFGRPYYRSRLWYSMSSVCLSVCRLSVTFCIQAKRLDRFARNFQGRCGLTMGRPDYILDQFGETARCRDTNFFVSNITRQEAQLLLGWPTVLPHNRRSTQKLWRIHVGMLIHRDRTV